jgi:2-C-methyl-D-erythritol 4-phosphate cytidylyltransferase
MVNVAVIIPAGGRGKRLGGVLPKQFLRLGDTPILVASVRVFERLPEVREVLVVAPAAYVSRTTRLLKRARCRKVSCVITGGRERQDSVRLGLEHLSTAPDVILVHDAVRPLVTAQMIRGVITAAKNYGAAVVGVPVKDTIKLEGKKGFYTKTLPRHLLWAVQTPQGFLFPLFRHAHVRAAAARVIGTDDAALVERLGIPVRIVQGDQRNIKITTKEDLAFARAWWRDNR